MHFGFYTLVSNKNTVFLSSEKKIGSGNKKQTTTRNP